MMKQYLVTFITKKGGEEDHEALTMARNAKEAISNIKELWYSENTMHAFCMKATRVPEPAEETPETTEAPEVPETKENTPTETPETTFVDVYAEIGEYHCGVYTSVEVPVNYTQADNYKASKARGFKRYAIIENGFEWHNVFPDSHEFSEPDTEETTEQCYLVDFHVNDNDVTHEHNDFIAVRAYSPYVIMKEFRRRIEDEFDYDYKYVDVTKVTNIDSNANLNVDVLKRLTCVRICIPVEYVDCEGNAGCTSIEVPEDYTTDDLDEIAEWYEWRFISVIEDSENEQEQIKDVSEVKCIYCHECIHCKKCAVNAPHRMECKSDCLSLCGSPVCCEDFVSRKSIDDIYEEQKRTEPKYEPEDDIDFDISEVDDLDLLEFEDDEMPF